MVEALVGPLPLLGGFQSPDLGDLHFVWRASFGKVGSGFPELGPDQKLFVTGVVLSSISSFGHPAAKADTHANRH